MTIVKGCFIDQVNPAAARRHSRCGHGPGDAIREGGERSEGRGERIRAHGVEDITEGAEEPEWFTMQRTGCPIIAATDSTALIDAVRAAVKSGRAGDRRGVIRHNVCAPLTLEG